MHCVYGLFSFSFFFLFFVPYPTSSFQTMFSVSFYSFYLILTIYICKQNATKYVELYDYHIVVVTTL